MYQPYLSILSVRYTLYFTLFSLELFTDVTMLTCSLSVLRVRACGGVRVRRRCSRLGASVSVCVRAKQRSPHAVLACNLCH